MKDYIITTLARHKQSLVILYLIWGSYFVALFSRLISTKPEGLWVGHVNLWSDWALHVSIANTFAFKPLSLWFSFNPIYAGGQATYPFVADFLSGMLMRLGFSIQSSFIIPSIFFAFLLITGIYFLGYLLLKSKIPAVLSVFLFFLTPSLGFINYIGNFFKGTPFFSNLYPIIEYSRFEKYDWLNGNVIVGLIVPQRTFLVGMAITIWVLIGLIYCFSRKDLAYTRKRNILLFSGIFAGLLPIIHPHSFMTLIVISACLCLINIKRWKLLLWYVIPATIISSLLFYTFVYGGIENSSFISWLPGWVETKSLWRWFIMWAWISGISLPLSILGWSVAVREKTAHAFFAGIFIVFIIANLFLFQPIRWDNSKLFFWSFLGFAYLGSLAIYWLWQKKYLGKVIAIVLLCTVTITGVLEVVRLQNVRANGHILTNTEDINLGLQIRSNTDPSSRFLTAPAHNHLVMVWGLRQILMGYTAWVWNYGFLYQDRERDMKQMYLGGTSAEELLRKYQISYVVIGPSERADLHANEEYFSSKFPLVFKNSRNNVYDTRSLLP